MYTGPMQVTIMQQTTFRILFMNENDRIFKTIRVEMRDNIILLNSLEWTPTRLNSTLKLDCLIQAII
jgi:hypothetical protein